MLAVNGVQLIVDDIPGHLNFAKPLVVIFSRVDDATAFVCFHAKPVNVDFFDQAAGTWAEAQIADGRYRNSNNLY
jgi:hypothetical protein